jgi:hypothetical protein
LFRLKGFGDTVCGLVVRSVIDALTKELVGEGVRSAIGGGQLSASLLNALTSLKRALICFHVGIITICALGLFVCGADGVELAFRRIVLALTCVGRWLALLTPSPTSSLVNASMTLRTTRPQTVSPKPFKRNNL